MRKTNDQTKMLILFGSSLSLRLTNLNWNCINQLNRWYNFIWHLLLILWMSVTLVTKQLSIDHLHPSKNILVTFLIAVASSLDTLNALKSACNQWESGDQWCHKWVIWYVWPNFANISVKMVKFGIFWCMLEMNQVFY